jgi:hypothetical protein
MHTIFRAIVIALLLALIIGCSSVEKQPASVSESGRSITEKHTDEENLTRFLMYDQHSSELNPASLRTFSDEGLGNDDSMLVDCIAASYWEYNNGSSTFRFNYVLVCDTKYSTCGTWTDHPRCDIIRMTVGDRPTVYDHTSYENIGATVIRDPDSCDLVVCDNELHAWVWDERTDNNIIYHYKWNISISSGNEGALGIPTCLGTIDDVPSAKGIAAVFGESSSEYHLIICSRTNNEVRYCDESVTDYDDQSNGAELIKDFGNDSPLDACVTKYDDEIHLWNVYVAVRHVSDQSSDYIYCSHWDGSDYTYGLNAANMDGPDEFPAIISLAARRYDDHDSGSICALMMDTRDFIGYRLEQVNFRSQVIDNGVYNYHQYDIEFDDTSFQDDDTPNAKIYLAQGFAMGKFYNPRLGGNDDYGNWYYISDRDPECLKNLDFNNYDGKNVKGWHNLNIDP